ncbi:unnamed protein product [Paramecium sonneborni]|uniref:Uncharacterized protein n=1 Tax=Paramecium sonneborni TaxID=65129 RepID=A0A8S1PKK7_9CILI|nr:unnamed protein product [Paramecium sonneborni]
MEVLEFFPDCKYLISCAQLKILLIWDVKQMKLINKFSSEHFLSCLMFSSDGQVLVSHSDIIVLWDMSNIREPNIIWKVDNNFHIIFIIVSTKQGHMISMDDIGLFTIWDVQSGKIIEKLRKCYTFAIFNDDGNKFAAYDWENVEIWKLQGNIFVIEHSLEALNRLRFFNSNSNQDQLLKNSYNYKYLLKKIIK